jgi:hypothetical protein
LQVEEQLHQLVGHGVGTALGCIPICGGINELLWVLLLDVGREQTAHQLLHQLLGHWLVTQCRLYCLQRLVLCQHIFEQPGGAQDFWANNKPKRLLEGDRCPSICKRSTAAQQTQAMCHGATNSLSWRGVA